MHSETFRTLYKINCAKKYFNPESILEQEFYKRCPILLGNLTIYNATIYIKIWYIKQWTYIDISTRFQEYLKVRNKNLVLYIPSWQWGESPRHHICGRAVCKLVRFFRQPLIEYSDEASLGNEIIERSVWNRRKKVVMIYCNV